MITSVPTRRDLYQQFLPQGAVGAELGVFEGANAYELFVLTHPSKLYLVDPYAFPGAEIAREKATALMQHTTSIGVEFVCQNDWDWIPTLPKGHLDWVYLDTRHQREPTVRELEVLLDHMDPGGLIAGHDFAINPMWGTGVIGPVLDAVQERRIELLALSEEFPYPSFIAKVL
ncbi:MAG: class I SAM-dependent methyltransferase [Pirellulaceae bacterium]|jgi:hypothetical protein|nr:class I SAM-dependent methyltransferase [Pirellulaceae bacterium]